MTISIVRRNIALCFAVIVIIGGLTSCTVTTTGSQTDAITRANGWVFDSFSVGTPNATQKSVYTGMTVVFTASGSVTFTPTATGAAALGSKTSYSGTWSLSSLEVITINVQDLGLSGNYAIAELTATTFRFNTGGASGLEWKWTAK
jgi:hypothetical protein